MNLPQATLAGIYEVSPPALRQLRIRHGIPLEVMAQPAAFLAALQSSGARKARVFRQLDDPASRARITEIITALHA